MVNNAAGNSISKSDNLSPRGFDAISNIVMNGTFYVTRPCGAHWIKVGVAAMTQSLALEWGNRGIRLHVIAPGPFPTWMLSTAVGFGGATDVDWDQVAQRNPRRRVGTLEDIAGVAIFLSSRAGAYTVGETITCDGGAVASSHH